MSEEILDLIRQLEQRLGARFDAIQGDVASIGARLDAARTDVTRNGERLDAVRTDMTRNSGRLDAIHGDVANIGARLDATRTDVTRNGERLDAIQSDLGKLRQRFDSQPDMRLLGHNVEIMMERLSELEATSIRGFAALNDIAKESVTPGEVEALHSKVRDLSDARFGHEGRLRRLQRELNIAD